MQPHTALNLLPLFLSSAAETCTARPADITGTLSFTTSEDRIYYPGDTIKVTPGTSTIKPVSGCSIYVCTKIRGSVPAGPRGYIEQLSVKKLDVWEQDGAEWVIPDEETFVGETFFVQVKYGNGSERGADDPCSNFLPGVNGGQFTVDGRK